jgi:hypothetical protein
LITDHFLGAAAATNIDVTLRMIVMRVKARHPIPEWFLTVWHSLSPPHDLKF